MRILLDSAVREFLCDVRKELGKSEVSTILHQCAVSLAASTESVPAASTTAHACHCTDEDFSPDNVSNEDLLSQKRKYRLESAPKDSLIEESEAPDEIDCLESDSSSSSFTVEPLLLSVLENLWERLHTGHWKDVPEQPRIEYATGCLLMACVCSEDGRCLDSLLWLDEAILLGHPVGGDLITDLASSVHAHMMSVAPHPVCHALSTASLSSASLVSPLLKTTDIPAVIISSGSDLESLLSCGEPRLLKHSVDHWPALKKWSLPYIASQAAYRTVPVEIGQKYSDDSWGQRLMTIGVFLETYFTDEAHCIAYLAQHDLLHQVPAFAADAPVPDEVAIRDEKWESNVWLGPAGTVSPFHTDPRSNFFVQVFGKKQFILAHPDHGPKLYPLEGRMNNTAKFDPENVNFEEFPDAAEVKFETVTLDPGDVLLLPAKWWHYVKSLEPSCSVNFWFN